MIEPSTGLTLCARTFRPWWSTWMFGCNEVGVRNDSSSSRITIIVVMSMAVGIVLMIRMVVTRATEVVRVIMTVMLTMTAMIMMAVNGMLPMLVIRPG